LNKDYDLYAASTSGFGFHHSQRPFMCVSWYLVVRMSFKVLIFFPYQGVLYAYYLDMCDKDGRSLVGHIDRNINYVNDLGSSYNRLIKETYMLYARRDDIVAEANKHKTNEVTKKM